MALIFDKRNGLVTVVRIDIFGFRTTVRFGQKTISRNPVRIDTFGSNLGQNTR